MTEKVIVACSCGNMGNYSQTQFKIQHPKEELPKLYVGKKGYDFLEKLPKDSEAYQFVAAVLKKRGRYSYLIEHENGKMVDAYNYLKRERAIW